MVLRPSLLHLQMMFKIGRNEKPKPRFFYKCLDSIIPHVRDITTSTGTLNALKGLYEITNSNRILFLKSKLLSINMEANENVSNYLSRIKDLRDKLVDIGESI